MISSDRACASAPAGGLSPADGANKPVRSWALVCPDCAVRLESRGQALRCPRCGRHWPVVGGIPHFVQEFPYWGEIPLPQMLEVNRLAAAGDWKAALLESADPAVRRASEMICNLERANWHWLLPLPPETRVLDLGAGTGTTSHALALHYRQVVAVEPVLERVSFMRHRFAQEGLSNVELVRASIWELPLPKESFDLVAMNGILEWVAEGVAGDPGRLQRLALEKVLSLLRPGGYLYLGIENRLRPGYFIGHPDPHCGLAFVTVLPRPMAHWFARRNGLAGYRNYLYSSRGYRRLLHKVGFGSVEVYIASPSYNHPRFLIPLNGGPFSYYAENFNPAPPKDVRRPAYRMLLKLKLLQHLEYSFAILARK